MWKARVDSLAEGLQFGQRIQGETFIGGQSGIVSEMLVLSAIAAHLDQLSEYQCRRVQHIAEAWLQTPSFAATMLIERERDILHRLDNRRIDPDALLTVLKASLTNPTGAEGDGLDTIRPYALQHPEGLADMMRRAALLAAKYYDTAIANLSLPISRRIQPPFPGGDSPECKLLAIMMSETEISYSANAYDALEAKIRLFGVHAAIHRYRWEHNRLPDTLAELHIGALNTDPFTGEGFLYKREGDAYDLSSFGPMSAGVTKRSDSPPPRPVRL